MKKTLFVLACCLISHLAQAAEDSKYVEYWVPGVSRVSGWKDVNKQMTEDDDEHEIYTGDSHLCWAAAASNVISWWQDYNADHLANHKEGIPQGEGPIFSTYNDGWRNVGFDGYWGLRWFMDGAPELYTMEIYEGYMVSDVYMDPDSLVKGGFYNDVISDITSTATMNGVSQLVTDEFGYVVEDVIQLEDFTSELVSAVSTGGVTLGITGTVGKEVFGHAITLWGVKVNKESGLIETMWVTDSDDLITYGEDLDLIELTCKPVTKEQMVGDGVYKDYQVYSIEEKEGRWYSGKYNEYVDSFGWLSANVQWSIPEPATGTLSLLALAGLAARRRRK